MTNVVKYRSLDKGQHAFLYADLLSTLERVVVAGHVRHDSSLIRFGSVDQIYIISQGNTGMNILRVYACRYVSQRKSIRSSYLSSLSLPLPFSRRRERERERERERADKSGDSTTIIPFIGVNEITLFLITRYAVRAHRGRIASIRRVLFLFF